MASKESQLDLDWAADLELLASALDSGLLMSSAFSLLADRASASWRLHFQQISRDLETESSIQVALTQFKANAADPRFDYLLELLMANSQFGGSKVVSSLKRAAREHRVRATARDEVAGRISAIVSVARLGSVAPWFMVAMLCTRAENLNAYFTGFGPTVLALGAGICFAALGMIQRLARLPKNTRGLAA